MSAQLQSLLAHGKPGERIIRVTIPDVELADNKQVYPFLFACLIRAVSHQSIRRDDFVNLLTSMKVCRKTAKQWWKRLCNDSTFLRGVGKDRLYYRSLLCICNRFGDKYEITDSKRYKGLWKIVPVITLQCDLATINGMNGLKQEFRRWLYKVQSKSQVLDIKDRYGKRTEIIARSQWTVGRRLGVSQSTVSRMGRKVRKNKIVEITHYVDIDGLPPIENKDSTKYQLEWRETLPSNFQEIAIRGKQTYTFADEGDEIRTLFLKSSSQYWSSNQIRSTLGRASKTYQKHESDGFVRKLIVGDTILWCLDKTLRKEILKRENQAIVRTVCPGTRPKRQSDTELYVRAIKRLEKARWKKLHRKLLE